MMQKPDLKTNKKGSKTRGYQSPLSKLFTRQQPKVRAKEAMAKLLMTYAEEDYKRIAVLLSVWIGTSSR